MTNQMSACACMGPPGNCPCQKAARGEKIAITESHISADLFELLSDEDKNTINDLKAKALGIYLTKKNEQEIPIESQPVQQQREAYQWARAFELAFTGGNYKDAARIASEQYLKD